MKNINDVCSYLESICDKVNEAARMAAHEGYLKSERHRFFLIAENCKTYCEQELKKVKKGALSPVVRFVCCEACFKGIMTEESKYDYTAYAPYLEYDDPEWRNARLSSTPKGNDLAHLQSYLDGTELVDVYTGCASCQEDEARRTSYLKSFQDLLRAAIRLAKRQKSPEAAFDLLEALRLTLSSPAFGNGDVCTGPVMTSENASAAYHAANRGFARLWASIEYGKVR